MAVEHSREEAMGMMYEDRYLAAAGFGRDLDARRAELTEFRTAAGVIEEAVRLRREVSRLRREAQRRRAPVHCA